MRRQRGTFGPLCIGRGLSVEEAHKSIAEFIAQTKHLAMELQDVEAAEGAD